MSLLQTEDSPQNNLIVSKDSFSAAVAVPHLHRVCLARGLVDEHARDGGVEHDVQVGALAGRAQERARHAQPRAVAVGGLRDREAGVVLAVQVAGGVAWGLTD